MKIRLDVVKQFAGTRIERWVFSPDNPRERCTWPSAAVAARLEDELRSGAPSPQALLAAASVLEAYRLLLVAPITELAVARLRKLRRAEMEAPRTQHHDVKAEIGC